MRSLAPTRASLALLLVACGGLDAQPCPLGLDQVECPIAGEDAWVVVPSTVRLDGPGGSERQGLERFAIGERLVVARNLEGVPSDFVTVLVDGLPTGFVATGDIDRAPPSAERQLEAARAAVRDGDLLRAAPLVKHLLDEQPGRGDLAAFSAALSAVAAGGVPELGPVAMAPAVPVTGPGRAWVVAEGQGEPVRAGLAPWSLGAEVRVLSVQGDMAVVALGRGAVPTPALAVGPIDGPPDAITAARADAEAHAGRMTQHDATTSRERGCPSGCWGWLPVGALDAVAPDAASLARRAAELSDGLDPEASDLARGAVRLGRLDAFSRAQLQRVASKLNDDVLAVALMVGGPVSDTSRRGNYATGSVSTRTWSVELRSFLGCRGEAAPEMAVHLPASSDLLPPPPTWDGPEAEAEAEDPARALAAALSDLGDACLTDVPVWRPCDEPAPPSDLELDEAGSAETRERRRDEADAEYLAAERAWLAYTARHDRWLETLQEAFPGPRLRVSVRNAGAAPTAEAQLVLYSYQPRLTGYCGHVEGAYRQDLQHHSFSLPSLAPGEALTLWFDVPAYALDHGAFVAADAAEIARLMSALAAPWMNGSASDALPFVLPDWARDRAAQDGPGPDACPTMTCGC